MTDRSTARTGDLRSTGNGRLTVGNASAGVTHVKRALTVSILLACGSLSCTTDATTTRDVSGWSIYRNAKYGYQIAYPDGYVLWETGREGERDGRSIRIGLKDYAALTPVLEVQVHPERSLYERSAGGELRDMQVEVMDIDLAGLPARQVEFRFKTTGDLAFVEIHRDDALFLFHAAAGLREFEGTVWWKIVSTFQLQRG